MYKIACIMGKSSSGKDHIYKALLEDKSLKLKNVVIYTTRPMRDGECEGVEYFFRDNAFVEDMKQQNKIIELRGYNTVNGLWQYLTVDDGQIDLNKGRYLIIGTLEAYNQFVEYYGKDVVMPIYIEVDDDIRLLRAIAREKQQSTPQYEELCRRFLADAKDFSKENLAKSNITKKYTNNGDICECIDAISADIARYM